MAGRFCQDCGSTNAPDAKFCERCGAELRTGIPPAAPTAPPGAPPAYGPAYGPAYPPPAYYGPPGYAVPPPYPYPYPPGYAPPYPPPIYGANLEEVDRKTKVDRTKWGLILLAIGLSVGWIPIAAGIGGFLSLIGAVLVILGRNAFGVRHGRYVLLSAVLYIASLVIAAAFFLWWFSASLGVAIRADPRGYLPVFWPFIEGLVGAGFIGAVAQVFFVYGLEDRLGRLVLYAAFAAAVAGPIVAVLVLAPAYGAVLDAIRLGALTNPGDPRLGVLEAAADTLNLARAVSLVLFAVACFLAWRRIDRKEIPAPVVPAGAPPAVAPPAPPYP